MNTNTLDAQTEAARQTKARYGYTVPAIVTETRLNRLTRRTHFGFRFQNAEIGEEITNPDGSISIVRAVV